MWPPFGLGDCATDVTTQLGGDYVHAGAVLEYQASVEGSSLTSAFSTFNSKIANAVGARGYRGVNVSGPSAGLWTDPFGGGSVTIRVTAPVDQSSKKDVEDNISGAISTVGLRVTSSRIAFISRPSVADICSGQAQQRAVTGRDQGKPPGECDFFCQVGKIFESDTSKYLALAGVGLAAWLIIGKFK